MSEVLIPKTFMKKISELKSNPVNVKQHSEEQINDLVILIAGGKLKNGKQFKGIGFKDPVVIDDQDVIWAGHGRIMAAKKIGMLEVPCVLLGDLTDIEKQMFLIMDNKINESPWEYLNFKTVFDAVSPALSEVFQSDFSELIEYSTRPNPDEWAQAFSNEGEVEADSVQITFNIPIEKETKFREYLKSVDERSKDTALMKMYQFCKKNMKS